MTATYNDTWARGLTTQQLSTGLANITPADDGTVDQARAILAETARRLEAHDDARQKIIDWRDKAKSKADTVDPDLIVTEYATKIHQGQMETLSTVISILGSNGFV